MTDKNNNGFKTSSAKFQGYVTRALEDIGESLKNLIDKTDQLDKRMTNIQIKVAGIGATVSFITTLLFLLVKELLAR